MKETNRRKTGIGRNVQKQRDQSTAAPTTEANAEATDQKAKEPEWEADFEVYLRTFESSRLGRAAILALEEAYKSNFTDDLKRLLIRQCFFASRYERGSDPYFLWRRERADAKELEIAAANAREIAKFCRAHPQHASRVLAGMNWRLGKQQISAPSVLPDYPNRTSPLAMLYQQFFDTLGDCLETPDESLQAAKYRLGCVRFEGEVTASLDASFTTKTMLLFALGWCMKAFDCRSVLYGAMGRGRRRASVMRAFLKATKLKPEKHVGPSGYVQHPNRATEAVDEFLKDHPGALFVNWPEANMFGLPNPR